MRKFIALSLAPIIILVPPLILANSNFDSSTYVYGNAPYGFSNISGVYTIPNLGFQITFPEGWSGIGLKGFIMLSPNGINSKTAVPNPSSDLDKVILVLSLANLSDILDGLKVRNLSSYQQYVEDNAKTIGCQIISDKFIKVNGTNWEEVHQVCGPQSELKVKSFAIASGKTVIFVGIKGKNSAFDHNVNKFDDSINTIKMNKVTNIKRLLSSTQ